jgi:hypothetical protein
MVTQHESLENNNNKKSKIIRPLNSNKLIWRLIISSQESYIYCGTITKKLLAITRNTMILDEKIGKCYKSIYMTKGLFKKLRHI